MEVVIDIKDVSVSIDKKSILTGVTVVITKGAIVGLLGPSGAGKTTLIRSIIGLQKLTTGSIYVLGVPAGTPALHVHVGYVTQAPSVYGDLTVGENLRYFASLLNASRAQVLEVLNSIELAEFENRIVASLSGGQRARVSLAVALLGAPKILLLDEPTVGLDPVLRQKLWATFRQLAAQGITILISSHVMDEADKCDELLFVRGGVILARGMPKSIMSATHAKNMEEAFLRLAEEKTP